MDDNTPVKRAKSSAIEWSPKRLALADLKPYDKNPRKPKDQGVDGLDQSIGKFGLAEPIIVHTDMTVIGGHQRLDILKKRGTAEAWCVMPSRQLTEEELSELNIRLNQNIAGEWDWKVISNHFDVEQLEEFGFDELEIDLNMEMEKEVAERRRAAQRVTGDVGTMRLELLFEKKEHQKVVMRALKELMLKHGVRLNGEALHLEALEKIRAEEEEARACQAPKGQG